MSSSLFSQVTASPAPPATAVAVNFGWLWSPFLSQEEFSAPAALFPTLPTCSSSCMTANAARGCSCSSTRLQCASLVWRRRMRRSTGTCVPHIAICWTAATSSGSVKAELWAGAPIPNCEHKSPHWWKPTPRSQPWEFALPNLLIQSAELVRNVQGKMFVWLMKAMKGGDWERRRIDQSCFHSLIMVPLIILISDWVCFNSCAL